MRTLRIRKNNSSTDTVSLEETLRLLECDEIQLRRLVNYGLLHGTQRQGHVCYSRPEIQRLLAIDKMSIRELKIKVVLLERELLTVKIRQEQRKTTAKQKPNADQAIDKDEIRKLLHELHPEMF